MNRTGNFLIGKTDFKQCHHVNAVRHCVYSEDYTICEPGYDPTLAGKQEQTSLFRDTVASLHR